MFKIKRGDGSPQTGAEGGEAGPVEAGGRDLPVLREVAEVPAPVTPVAAAPAAPAAPVAPATPVAVRIPRADPSAPEGKPSVLSYGVELKGKFACAGPLHVEGAIEGSVSGPFVTVGAGGRIEGDVSSDRLSLLGQFKGTAVCGTVTLGPNAQADGDITCDSMTLARGAVLEGRVAIGAKGTPRVSAA